MVVEVLLVMDSVEVTSVMPMSSARSSAPRMQTAREVGNVSVHLAALSVMEYAVRVFSMPLTSVNQHVHQVPTARVQISAFLYQKMLVHHIVEQV